MSIGRIKPNVKVRKPSPHQSERSGRPNLIVIHSTESHDTPKSAKDLKGLGSWFQNPNSKVSSHVGVDDDGNSARFVPDERKAWTCATFNSASLNVEMIGFASFGKAKWRRRWRQLRETARWIARWSKQEDIPIRRGKVSGPFVTRSGVITHSELGFYGGNHSDPGPFPMKRVLVLARLYKAALK